VLHQSRTDSKFTTTAGMGNMGNMGMMGMGMGMHPMMMQQLMMQQQQQQMGGMGMGHMAGWGNGNAAGFACPRANELLSAFCFELLISLPHFAYESWHARVESSRRLNSGTSCDLLSKEPWRCRWGGSFRGGRGGDWNRAPYQRGAEKKWEKKVAPPRDVLEGFTGEGPACIMVLNEYGQQKTCTVCHVPLN